jgi:hypothetical protein
MENNEMQQQNGMQLEVPMTLGEWLITMIILMVPCVNIVMLFVWGFGNGNVNRKNYARATLIVMAIGVVLGAIFWASFAAMFANALQGAY